MGVVSSRGRFLPPLSSSIGAVIGVGGVLPPRGGECFWLRDRFLTDRPAGTINGTPAEEGPGTRTVVDTLLNAVIAAGQLDMTPKGVPSFDDPGILYDAQARAAGLALLIEVTPGVTNALFNVGYFDASPHVVEPSVAHNDNMFYFASGGLVLFSDGGGQRMATYAAATTYTLCVVLRATGAHYLIKGGTYTSWTLLYVLSTINTTPMYPGAINYSSTFSVDDILIRCVVWTPTPVASDSFNRTDGALGNTDGAGCEEAGGAGLVWTAQSGTWAISTNKARGTAPGTATVDSGDADIILLCNVDPADATGTDGIVIRYTDDNNHWLCRWCHGASDRVEINEVNVGVTTLRASTALVPGVDGQAYNIVMVADGQTITVCVNNGSRTSYAVAALNETITVHGLWGAVANADFDNFVIFPRGTGNEYTALDGF